MFGGAERVNLGSPLRRVNRQLTIPIFQIEFDVLFNMLEQPDSLLERNVFHRVVEEGIIYRYAVEFMAIIVDNSAIRVVPLWYRSTRDGVK